MDPNKALENCRKGFQQGDYVELAHAFHALDGWMMKGGFLPGDWQAAQDASPDAVRAALARPPYNPDSDPNVVGPMGESAL